MAKQSSNRDEAREWWERTWREREGLLRSVFGRTEPPDSVIAFSWNNLAMVIPGACSLVFPPDGQQRDHWLYLSVGLTQPLNQHEANKDVSGYGWEFAIATATANSWAPGALYELLTYWVETKVRMDVGHRIPMVYYPTEDGQIRAMLRDVEAEDPYLPLGQMRALLLWPYLLYPDQVKTSTGRFGILIGTSITMEEWGLAKSASSTHLLLLLFENGIGQVSKLNRLCITKQLNFDSQWDRIRHLSNEQAETLLRNAASLQGE